jgi:hypothetical protein
MTSDQDVDPLPPHLPPAERLYLMEMAEKYFPKLFGKDTSQHECVYRSLTQRFVAEDIQRKSLKRVAGES